MTNNDDGGRPRHSLTINDDADNNPDTLRQSTPTLVRTKHIFANTQPRHPKPFTNTVNVMPNRFTVAKQLAQVQENVPDLSQLVENLSDANPQVLHESLVNIRKTLSGQNPPIDHVLALNVLPRLVQFLTRHDTPTIQFEAAWALTNIASGTSAHTKATIDHGAVPTLIGLLESSNDDVREQAVWALGNIAGDSPSCRNKVLHSGALGPLLAQLQPHSKVSMLRNATWTLSNLCRGKPQPAFDLVKPALPTLAQLIYQQDDEVLTDACWALSCLSDGPNEKIQAVIESGLCTRLVELLMHPSPAVHTSALRAVGNIVTGDDLQTQVIINCGALSCLPSLLASPKKGVRKEACWTISNITAGNSNQIQSVIDANIIPPLINLLTNAELDVKREAAWAISNATSCGTSEQIDFLAAQGCIPALCDLLDIQDTKIVPVALEGLENILKSGGLSGSDENPYVLDVEKSGGLDKLDNLQDHESNDIYEHAVKILEVYFGAVDEDEVPANPFVAKPFGMPVPNMLHAPEFMISIGESKDDQ